MAISRTKTWIAGEVLTAADLNAEFSNIINNGEDVGWPATKAKDFDGQRLILDADADTSITSDTDDQIDIEIAGADDFRFTANTFTALSGSTISVPSGASLVVDSGGTLTADTVGETTADTGVTIDSLLIKDGGIVPSEQIASRNGIINGDFRVAQRGTSFTAATTPANNDDTYLLDRWILLSDGNDIVDVSQETSAVPSGAYAAAKALVATANKKFGFLQVLEARDSAKFIGQTASLSFKARTTTGAVIRNIRAAILSWSSTADSVTSDVVSAWGAEGANPTFAANWTAENTPSDISVTADSYATHKIENVSIDTASTNNVAVFIWVDDTDAAANDELYIADVQLELGSVATPFERRPINIEEALAHRLYREFGRAAANESFAQGLVRSATRADGMMQLTTPMRSSPSVSISAASDFHVLEAGAVATVCTAFAASQLTADAIGFVFDVASGLTAGESIQIRAQTTSARIKVDAEL